MYDCNHGLAQIHVIVSLLKYLSCNYKYFQILSNTFCFFLVSSGGQIFLLMSDDLWYYFNSDDWEKVHCG